uniref:PAZ domain-containing protein n=1 Tax=Meloidogyne enterolobii TaxID=390850 RepID=A0A6V7Y7X5_MELEN|nr:unnamed protein product [Meloidogyne enterolobii]
MLFLIDECAKILHCHPKSLRDQIHHPSKRALLVSKLKGRKVRTLYSDRNGFRKTFTINGLTYKGAHCTMAYGALSRPFNVSVAAHFYSRHRIRLQYPYLQCVIEHFPRRCEDRFYPLELLEFVDEKEEDYIGFNLMINHSILKFPINYKLIKKQVIQTRIWMILYILKMISMRWKGGKPTHTHILHTHT